MPTPAVSSGSTSRMRRAQNWPDVGPGSSRVDFHQGSAVTCGRLGVMSHATVRAADRRLFWGVVWLAAILVATKAYYLGLPAPHGFADGIEYVRSLAAISYTDLWFAVGFWALARVIMALLIRWPAMV